MRILWLTILSLIFLITPLTGEIIDDYNLHYNFLDSLPSRGEGSVEESKVFRYILTYAQRLDVDTAIHTFKDLEGDHSYSSIIEVIIPGQSQEEVVYLFPTSQPPFSTKNTLSGSIALGITLMPILAGQNNLLTSRIVFLGGDRETSYIGSQEYLRILQQEPVDRQFIYSTFDDIPSKMGILTSSNGITTPLYQLELLANSFRDFNVPISLNHTQNQIQRLRIDIETSPLELYLETGYPAIELSQAPGERGEKDPTGIVRALGSLTLQEVDTTKSERNYLALQNASALITIRERTYIFVVGGLFLLFLILSFLRKRKFFRYVLSIRHHLSSLVVITILTFLSMILGGALLVAISNLRGIQNFYAYTPLFMILGKLSLALLVILLVKEIIPQHWVIANNSFYSASAIFILGVVAIGVSLLDITLSLYFFFPIMFMVLSILTKKRWIKMLLFLLSLMAMIGNVILVMNSFTPRIYYILTLSPKGTILETLLLLPYGLLLLRIMQRDMLKKSQAVLRISIISFLAVTLLGSFTYLFMVNPFSPESPMIVKITQTETPSQQFLQIKGEAPFDFTELGETLKIDRNNIQDSNIHPLGEIESSHEKRGFLNRIEHTITITTPGQVSQVNAFLDISRAIPVIYDTNFPVSFDFENQEAQFFIGPNPPNPLEITFTLDQNTTSNLRLETIFHNVNIPSEPYINNMYTKDQSRAISILNFPIRP